MKRLKFGIIGCGGIANQKHLPALTYLNEEVEIVGLCDIIVERAQKAKKEYGLDNATVYEDYQELLKDETIDVIHVCTPNVSHSFITVEALEAGKHVLCEKPMAINSQEAKKMIEAAERTGKKLTIGYQNRYRDDAQFAHKVCSAGELGDIYYGEAYAIRRRAVPTWGVFMDKEKQGGGPLIDIGTHALDLTLWMMDNYEPAIVVGSTFSKLTDKPEANMFGPWDPKTFDVEDSAFGFIKMKNGATIFLKASWALNTTDTREAMFSLSGTEAGFEMTGSAFDGTMTYNINSEKNGQLIETKPAKAAQIAYFSEDQSDSESTREVRQWLDAIHNDREPCVKPTQAYVVTQILEAIYESEKTGKAVYF